ncbi:MAG: 4-(cytidine 5'-diphospho)-2-C-methyl-D-erythritol kinase [Clostridiales bacterium]|nr:4-(cytidine 5'-diphospho)-2-C-methyl-D-erythritol kinase [Clostridiales bacterium]
MKSIQLRSRAKINLSLDVIRKRLDGYHEVKMIMQQIDLCDTITLTENSTRRIHIVTECEYIPSGEKNIAYIAAELLKKKLNIDRGVIIHIEKNIPVAAGLAGGSSNAAAVLCGLNELWDLRLTTKELMILGVDIGADVPFCVLGGAALAEGIGEKLTPIRGLQNVWIVICKPSLSVSTKVIYKQLDLSKLQPRQDLNMLIEMVEKGNLIKLAKNMFNVLEEVTALRYPIIKQIEKKMLEYNAIGSMMTGSGPTVFGIYKNYERAKSAHVNLLRIYKQTYIAQSYSKNNL